MSISKELNINNVKARVVYAGCDYMVATSPPDIKTLRRLPISSNTAYIRFNNELYYVDKAALEIQQLLLNPEQLINFQHQICPDECIPHQPQSLSFANLEWIEQQFNHTAPGSRKIKDIQFALTEAQRQEAIGKLYDRKVNAKNAAYTYIFQNYLARYEGEYHHQLDKLKVEEPNLSAEAYKNDLDHIESMHKWMEHLRQLSSQFIRFEGLINNPPYPAEPEKSLQYILDELQRYQNEITLKIHAIREYQDKQHPEILQHLSRLQQNLDKGVAQFRLEIESFKGRATKNDMACLFSIQTRAFLIPSLGSFVAEQIQEVLDAGIKVGYELSDNRLEDLLHLPIGLNELSDAKAMIKLKHNALDAAEYNDTYSPISSEMLSHLTGADDASASTNRKWFSIMPYVKDLNPADLDKIVCLVTNQSLENRKKAPYRYAFLAIGASLVEFVATVTLRLIPTAIFAAWDILFSGIGELPGMGFLKKKPEDKWTNYFDNKLSEWHQRFSPVRAAKQMWNQQYRRLDAALQPDHQALLKQCMDDSSLYHTIFAYFSPQMIADQVRSFFSSIQANVAKAGRDFLYLFSVSNYAKTPEEVYETIRAKYVLTKTYHQQLLKQTEADAVYPTVRYNPTNEISSPLEVFRDVMVTLDDVVIDSMFRKSPGPATMYFMLSMATLGTYTAPAAALAWMKSVPAWLQMPTEFLSKNFTGKSASLGFQEQMIACFLEWKFCFFSTELALEIQRGNFEFLNEMIKEPEKLTIGLVGLIGMGAALQFLPLLPTTISLPVKGLPPIYNFYAEVLNVFIEEAKSCAEGGTIGLTGLEYGFLGVKFAMLLHSMRSGMHEHEKPTPIQALVKACEKKQFLAKLIEACKQEALLNVEDENDRKTKLIAIVTNVFNETVELKHTLNQVAPDEVDAFKKALAEQILPAINDHKAYVQDHVKLKQNVKELIRREMISNQGESTLDKVTRELKEAIAMASDQENPIRFAGDQLKEANKFYDHLDYLFERYNAELIKADKAADCIDKRPFLDVFYNKHCYQGSNNFLRSLLFLPVPIPVPPFYIPGIYIGVALFRGIKFGLAALLNKPSMMHQVVKSFNKDLVLLLQIGAIIARTGLAFSRAISYSLRVLIGIPLLIVTACLYPLYYLIAQGIAATQRLLGFEPIEVMNRKSSFKLLDSWLCYLMALHHVTPPLHAEIHTVYANVSRTAGSGCDVHAVGQHVLADLNREETQFIRTSIGRVQAILGAPSKDQPESEPKETLSTVSELSSKPNLEVTLTVSASEESLTSRFPSH